MKNKKPSSFGVRKIRKGRFDYFAHSLWGTPLRQYFTMMTLCALTLMSIHAVTAAPSATPPGGNVVPTFDGLKVEDGSNVERMDVDNGGNLTLKNASGQTTINLNPVGNGRIALQHPTNFTNLVDIWNNGGTGAVEANSIFGKTYISHNAGGTESVVWMNGASQEILLNDHDNGNRRVEMNSKNGGLIQLYDDSNQTQMILNGGNGELTAKNIKATSAIGRFYFKEENRVVNVPAGNTVTESISCDNAAHQIVSCGGNILVVNGVVYNGSWKSGASCSSVFYNTTGAPQAGTSVYVDAYCFDPTSN